MAAANPPPPKPVLPDPGAFNPLERVPKTCTGAAFINVRLLVWMGVTIVAPCVMLTNASYSEGVRIAGWVLLAVGLADFLRAVLLVLYRGVLCPPPAPPRHSPLLPDSVGEKVPPRKLMAIYNPISGRGHATRLLKERLAPFWKERGIEVVEVQTTHARHATEIARTADLSTIDAIVVCGGDGSMHDVIQGLLSRDDEARQRVALGILPLGSGNDRADDMGLSRDEDGVMAGAARIAEGETHWVDLNCTEFDDKYRIYSHSSVNWGLTGDVGSIAEQWRVLGPARIDICAVWGIMKKARRPVKVTVDGKEVANTSILSSFVLCTQHFGKGLRVAPHAYWNDGQLDAYQLVPASRPLLLRAFLQLPTGRHDGVAYLQYQRARTMTMEPAAPGLCNIDGEIYSYESKVTVTCVPRCVRFLVPADCGVGVVGPAGDVKVQIS